MDRRPEQKGAVNDPHNVHLAEQMANQRLQATIDRAPEPSRSLRKNDDEG